MLIKQKHFAVAENARIDGKESLKKKRKNNFVHSVVKSWSSLPPEAVKLQIQLFKWTLQWFIDNYYRLQSSVPRDGSVCWGGGCGAHSLHALFLVLLSKHLQLAGVRTTRLEGLLASSLGQFSYLNMCVVLFVIMYSIPAPCMPVHKGRSLLLGLCWTCCLPVFSSECLRRHLSLSS